MGTGVGGGIVINKILHLVEQTLVVNGYHTLHRNGNHCYCGKTGCVELTSVALL